MLKKVCLLFLVSISFYEIMGQKNAIEFTTVENGTLKYFNSGQFDSLIIVGKAALKNKLDYFYLRYRMGYAYFNKNRFRQAAKQFEKARQFNSLDESTLLYLYYSYKYSGNEAEAMTMSKNISPLYVNNKKTKGKISLLNETVSVQFAFE